MTPSVLLEDKPMAKINTNNANTTPPPHLYALLVGGGLAMGLLVFFAVQTMPVFGWILWIIAIIAVGSGASLWYQQEFSMDARGDDDHRSVGQ